MLELRPIPGGERLGYQAGSDGRIYSKNGPLVGRVNSSGHRSVRLYGDAPGEGWSVSVHVLVAEAFVPNPNALPVVRHKDDDPANNVPENLAWGTHSDNSRDSVERGRHHQANKTHCPQKHPYNQENTYIDPGGGRHCRPCNRQSQRAAKARRLARERNAR